MSAPAGYPQPPFDEARGAVEQIPGGKFDADNWSWNDRYKSLNDEQTHEVFSVALTLVTALSGKPYSVSLADAVPGS